MELLLALTVGVLSAGAVYLFLARDLPRALIGFTLLGTAANLTILAAGRIGPVTPPLVPGDAVALGVAANPLPQALILTAIVIGFGLAAFALMLVLKAHARLGVARSEDMNVAEGIDPPAIVAPGAAAARSADREAA